MGDFYDSEWHYMNANHLFLDLQDTEGQTALHLAVMPHRSIAMIASLISKGAKVHLRDRNGKTALALALNRTENDGVVQTLLEYGASVDDLNAKGKEALLEWSLVHHDEKMVVSLLETGIGAETQYRGTLGLFLTGENTQMLLVFLNEVKVDWDGTRKDLQDALMFAVDHLCVESVEVLTRVTFESYVLTTALHRLIDGYIFRQLNIDWTKWFRRPENLSIIQRLVDCGADINAKREGKTVLFKMVESSSCWVEMIRLLLDTQADVNSDWKGISPLHSVLQRLSGKPDRRLVKALVQAGADVDGIETPDRFTALGLAYWNDHEDAFDIMVASRPGNPSMSAFMEQDLSTLADQLGLGCVRELGIDEVGESDS